MRATLRLITVWASVSVVIVVLGWSGLRSAVIAAIQGDTGGFSTVDLPGPDHRPGTTRSELSIGDDPAPRPVPGPRPTERPPRRPARERTSTPAPSAVVAPTSSAPTVTLASAEPSPQPSAEPSTPGPLTASPSSAPSPEPDGVTTVRTQGGTLLLHAAAGAIAVDDVQAVDGFSADGVYGDDGSLLFRFVGATHLSQVYAYVDAAGLVQIKVDEQDL